jgi:hypothetical protein
MAKRKSRRAVARNGTARRGHNADDTAEIEVDDPHATRTGQKIRVLRTFRDDPLARLHSRKQIDEAQYNAGRAYQRDVRTAERFVRSLDLARERVDGGAPSEPLTDAQVRARKRLTELQHVLGRTMHRVTHAVLVDGLSMETVAQQLFNRDGELSVKYYGRLFRDALDVLAGEYGLAGRR